MEGPGALSFQQRSHGDAGLYQRIIGMGMPVVPLILEELRREPHHWYWALEAITEQDPVPQEARGKIRDMATVWLAWGKSQRLISP